MLMGGKSKREVQINFRVNEREQEALKRASKREGVSEAEVLRRMLRDQEMKSTRGDVAGSSGTKREA